MFNILSQPVQHDKCSPQRLRKLTSPHALERKGYMIFHKIGQGCYATVHLAEYNEGSGRIKLACKVFDKAPRDILDKFFPRELEVLMRIDNPHTIHVHSIIERGPRVFIFMSFAENGDMLDFIKINGPLPEKQTKVWFRQVVFGLEYLHSINIAHRDLKCENILISKAWNAKIADFGFSRFCVSNDGKHVLSQTYCESAAYTAPEVVGGIPYHPKPADVWSLGVVLYMMINAIQPFEDADLKKLLRDQLARNWDFVPKVKHELSHGLVHLLKSILEPEVSQRITLDRK